MDTVYPIYSSLVSSFPYRAFSAGSAEAVAARNLVVYHSSKISRVAGEVEVDVAPETMKREVVCTLRPRRLFKSQLLKSADSHRLSLFPLYLTTSFLKRANLLIMNGKRLKGVER
ncbi:hypothetical protein GCK72_017993 [Caenorhabditis remanei]|uniref:Uncharacterized protein n=1 Tax=Caenorhabditis remanei TaxID=31234 RepID=A0A6A5GAD3_CAERE|nr:hypothetical protein GCK72_017993 [Caenorhabditis remanei]KAF1751439.1 hypothetical protein GCK72_017993 [Caenorhabditis remanei]